jgi:hypothetical protein
MIWLAKKHHDNFLHTDYFFLAIGLSLGAAAYFCFLSQPMIQAGFVIATGLFYILWGIIHHVREGDFHIKVILEYILIAVLAMALLLTLIFRA